MNVLQDKEWLRVVLESDKHWGPPWNAEEALRIIPPDMGPQWIGINDCPDGLVMVAIAKVPAGGPGAAQARWISKVEGRHLYLQWWEQSILPRTLLANWYPVEEFFFGNLTTALQASRAKALELTQEASHGSMAQG